MNKCQICGMPSDNGGICNAHKRHYQLCGVCSSIVVASSQKVCADCLIKSSGRCDHCNGLVNAYGEKYILREPQGRSRVQQLCRVCMEKVAPLQLTDEFLLPGAPQWPGRAIVAALDRFKQKLYPVIFHGFCDGLIPMKENLLRNNVREWIVKSRTTPGFRTQLEVILFRWPGREKDSLTRAVWVGENFPMREFASASAVGKSIFEPRSGSGGKFMFLHTSLYLNDQHRPLSGLDSRLITLPYLSRVPTPADFMAMPQYSYKTDRYYVNSEGSAEPIYDGPLDNREIWTPVPSATRPEYSLWLSSTVLRLAFRNLKEEMS